MSQRENIKRLTWLLNKVTSGYPSKDELLEYMDEIGYGCSTRTLERKLQEIRDELWINIKYDRQRKGYYIDESEVDHSDSLIRLFRLISSTDLLLENLKSGKDILQYIQFDKSNYLQGIELIPEIVPAIKNSIEIQLIIIIFTSRRHLVFH